MLLNIEGIFAVFAFVRSQLLLDSKVCTDILSSEKYDIVEINYWCAIELILKLIVDQIRALLDYKKNVCLHLAMLLMVTGVNVKGRCYFQ